jgi:hypothetical protein
MLSSWSGDNSEAAGRGPAGGEDDGAGVGRAEADD